MLCWLLLLGVWYSMVWFCFNDYYIIVVNFDDSGLCCYVVIILVVGVVFCVSEVWWLYVLVGCGFEILMFNELGYCVDG